MCKIVFDNVAQHILTESLAIGLTLLTFLYFFNNPESKTKECANFKFEVKSSVK